MSELRPGPDAGPPIGGPPWSDAVPETGGTWWSRHRQAKQRRLAGMTRGRRVARRLGIVATGLLAFLALSMVVAVVGFYQLSDVPRPTDRPNPQVASILYSDGSVMARIGTQNRTDVALSAVPQDVRWAVLAAEDRGFYSEHGISLRGTARAALNDLRGGDTQGGSGITQQYVKNVYTDSQRTLTRKFRELAIAVKIDRDYSKNQILEWYLNTIYFGRGAFGVQAAAQAYFGVDVGRLTLDQGALLAGLIQAPTDYDPATSRSLARQRWSYVLDGMVATGHLDAATRATLRFPKTIKPTVTQFGDTGPDGLIVRQVTAELQADGISTHELNYGGLQIRTTINKRAQQAALSSIDAVYGHLTKQQKKDKLREALVAVDPATGGVLAYYGGANGVGTDYALAWRAPGSSFKPFTLAAVLDANLAGDKPSYAINSIVDGSQPYKVDGLTINNDPGDAGYSHPQPITEAMKTSLNTAFARLADAVGPDNVAAAAHKAGIPAKKTSTAYKAAGQPTLADRDGHTDVTIGFGSYPVRTIDQATAFATFAAGGVHHAAYFVQKVTDSTGKVVFEHAENGTRAFSPQVANDVTVSMNQVAAWSGDALAGGRPCAAKTGTVGLDTSAGGNSDAWMVGFTPQVSAAVWTGNDQTSVPVVNRSGGQLYGRDMPGQAWKSFMDTYLDGKPVQPVATKQEILNSSVPKYEPPASTSAAPTSAAPTTTPAPSPTPTSSPPGSGTPSPTGSTSPPRVPPPTRSGPTRSSPR